MFCKNCGAEINANQAICVKCGVKTTEGKAYCGNCGAPVEAGASVCLKCGVSLKPAGNDLAGQDKIVMALIAFFLGGLGIHNFMMGETKKGIARLVASFCFGLGYILALIDLIKILTDSYVVDPEAII